MKQNDIQQGTKQYWLALMRLLRGQSPILNLDRPLDAAVKQCKVSCAWTAALVYVGGLIGLRPQFLSWQSISQHQQTVGCILAILSGIALGCIMQVCVYGLLRLYTLVDHVLVTTVFKVRGQRLRLLNLETELLPLGVITAIGLACLHLYYALGLAIICGTLCYAVIWLALGYNVIFHKERTDGLGLVLGGTFLTSLVFAIGSIAIAITFGVLAFILAAFIRPFHHVS